MDDTHFTGDVMPPLEVLVNLVELDLPIPNSWTPAASVVSGSSGLYTKLRRLHLTTWTKRLPTIPLFEYIAPFTSLETLELTDFQENHLLSDEIDVVPPQLPSVRCLRIVNCDLPMSLLARSLPNVCELHLHMIWNSSTADMRLPDRWLSLSHVTGLSPYRDTSWKLECPIYWLEMAVDYVAMRQEQHDAGGARALEAIDTASPMMLSLSLPEEIGPVFYTNLVVIAPGLQYLELELDCSEFPLWIGTIPQILCSLPLVCIKIRTSNFSQKGTVCSTEPVLRPLHTVLAKCIVSLQYICMSLDIKTCNVPHHSYYDYNHSYPGKPTKHGCFFETTISWCRVVDKGGERVPEPVEALVGERVAKYLRSAAFDTAMRLDKLPTF
ncbi:hypothetical protein B0H21DRAFT_211547 [Amylocystis lapponica]|nr:hypothetical protein B0H21DRAFT_211547 [Amylocystis lapponica]